MEDYSYIRELAVTAARNSTGVVLTLAQLMQQADSIITDSIRQASDSQASNCPDRYLNAVRMQGNSLYREILHILYNKTVVLF